jgi:hypothetical protein
MVGRFFRKIILNNSTPGIYSFLWKKTKNRLKIFFVTIGLRNDKVLNKVETKFLRTQTCHTPEEAEFYIGFKNVCLP